MDLDADYSDSVERGVRFLLDSVRRRGVATQDIAAFSKLPFSLAVAGHPSEALSLLHWIESRSPPDEFALGYLKDTARATLRAYFLAWLVLGANAAGNCKVRDQIGSAMLEYQNPRFGGFYSERRPHDQGVMNLGITNLCGYACLCIDRVDEATRAGDFVTRMVRAQPDPQRLCYRLDTERGLLLNYPVDTTKKGQTYSVVGSAILFLSELHRATTKDRFMRTAQGVFSFGLSCRRDILKSLPGGKFGWGSSLLYHIRRNASARLVAQRVASYLTGIQKDDGSWPTLGFILSRIELDRLRFWRYVKTDLTAEFVAILCQIRDNLG